VAISRAAVVSPTPGTPGSPSEGSPRSGGDAVARLHRRLVEGAQVAHPAHGEEDADRRVAHQLEEVAVAGDDVHRGRRGGARRQGADHVVGLVARHGHHR